MGWGLAGVSVDLDTLVIINDIVSYKPLVSVNDIVSYIILPASNQTFLK